MSREKQIEFRCKECPYKRVFRRHGNCTAEVNCEHPDKKYIVEYFEQHEISKFPTFLGYINSKGVFPVKKSPKWCPLKKKGGEG